MLEPGIIRLTVRRLIQHSDLAHDQSICCAHAKPNERPHGCGRGHSRCPEVE
jgi:hypothetical protein